MNVQLLNQVCEKIEAEPYLFAMGCFLHHTKCGTVACIAGHAVLLSTDKLVDDINSMARLFLNLTYDQANNLFFTNNWPWDFANAYAAAETASCEAHIAVLRIKHFIATNGQE